jgi:HD-GYP domain-containing protein (c-di-GMP phosphodiesterase class II)
MSNLQASSGGESRMALHCAAAGVVWISLADDRIVWPERQEGQSAWRFDLFAGSMLIRSEIEKLADTWKTSESPSAQEIFPGVWAMLSAEHDRRCEERGIAVFPTADLPSSEQFDLLCDSCGLEPDAVCREISEDIPLMPSAGVPALARIVRQMHAAEFALLREHESSDSVDRRLSESYEEIHLLHSLISGLVVGTEPDLFLGNAARELAEVCGFGWIAVLVDQTTEAFAPDHVVVGEGHPTRSELRRLARTHAEDGRRSSAAWEVEEYGEIVGCPILIEDQRLGTLMAGGRSCGQTSNVELKLVSASAGHIGIFLANASLYADLDAMFRGVLQAMVAAIDAKDPYTHGHSHRVALLSRDLAAALGMPDGFVNDIYLAGLVHDIGKIGVPESVLCKAGALTDSERAQIRQHPQIGHEILKKVPQMEELMTAVLCHHEAWDGGGYPAGISGEDIPIMARIIAVADSFDAMSSSRTYRSALSREKVFSEIQRCAGTQFDPTLVPTFLGLDLREYDRRLLQDSVTAPVDSSVKTKGEAA